MSQRGRQKRSPSRLRQGISVALPPCVCHRKSRSRSLAHIVRILSQIPPVKLAFSNMAFTVADRQEYLLGRERLPPNDAAVFLENRLAAESRFVHNEGLDRILTISEDQRRVQIRSVYSTTLSVNTL